MNLVEWVARRAGVRFMPHVSFGLFVLGVIVMVLGCFIGGSYVAGMVLAVYGVGILYLFEKVVMGRERAQEVSGEEAGRQQEEA